MGWMDGSDDKGQNNGEKEENPGRTHKPLIYFHRSSNQNYIRKRKRKMYVKPQGSLLKKLSFTHKHPA